jgi:hypothetical protein
LKRLDLVRRLEGFGCVLLRHGSKHDIYPEMTVLQGCSKTTYAVCVLTCFIWGSVYLGRAFDWRFAERYHLVIQIVPTAVRAACFGLDWLRAHFPRRF